jgi:hypothetical protein
VQECRELYERAQGRRESCGVDLGPDYHNAHLLAWTNGGATYRYPAGLKSKLIGALTVVALRTLRPPLRDRSHTGCRRGDHNEDPNYSAGPARDPIRPKASSSKPRAVPRSVAGLPADHCAEPELLPFLERLPERSGECLLLEHAFVRLEDVVQLQLGSASK